MGSADAERPLSLNQDGRLVFDWFNHLKGEPIAPFHIPLALRCQGPLRVSVLETALNAIVERHETLRTGFPDVTRLPAEVQRSLVVALRSNALVPPPLMTGRLHGSASVAFDVDAGEKWPIEGAMVRSPRALEEVGRPFVYGRPPLLHATLVELAADDYLLVFVFHHLICDGWSLGAFRRELTASYRHICADGPGARLAPLPMQYDRLAAQQREALDPCRSRSAINDMFANWRAFESTQLRARDLPGWLGELAAGSPIAARDRIECGAALTARVREYCLETSVTTYMAHLSALFVVCCAYARRLTMAIWGRYANRNSVESESIIGWCAGELLLGIDLPAASSVGDLMEAAREIVTGAGATGHVPRFVLERLLRLGDNPSRRPSDRVEIVLQTRFPDAMGDEPLTGDVGMRGITLPQRLHQHWIQFVVSSHADDTVINCVYPQTLMSPAGARRFLRDVRRALSIVIDRGDTPLQRVLNELSRS